MGKKLGNVQSSVSQLTVAFLVQSHISGWISWNFLLKKRVFLAWFQVLFFTAVILEFSTEDVEISIYRTSIGPGVAETEVSPWTSTERFGKIMR